MIVGLNGYAGSGKSSVAALLQIKQPHKQWKIMSFANKLREVASVLTGVPEWMFKEQDFKKKSLPGWGMTVREFLQKLGTEGIRDGVHTDAWVNALLSQYHGNENWIIDDCRFPNEAKAISDLGGIVVRVNRGDINPANNHASEIALNDWQFDYIIHNDGDTIVSLSALIEELIKKKL